MGMSELTFRADRLNQLMQQRKLNDGQLAYQAKLSKSMVFYLRTGGRDNVSATVAGRLAEILGTSVEYLVGMTDDAAPVKLRLDEELERLLHQARHLPRHRRRDLLRMAETFANENAQDQMVSVLGMVRELGGEEAETLLVGFLSSLRPDRGGLLDGEEAGEGTQGDE